MSGEGLSAGQGGEGELPDSRSRRGGHPVAAGDPRPPGHLRAGDGGAERREPCCYGQPGAWPRKVAVPIGYA